MKYSENLRLAQKAGVDPFMLNVAWTVNELWPEVGGSDWALDRACPILEEAILKDGGPNRSADDYVMALRYLNDGCGKDFGEIGRRDVLDAIQDGIEWYNSHI
jgi:hypothetical protein